MPLDGHITWYLSTLNSTHRSKWQTYLHSRVRKLPFRREGRAPLRHASCHSGEKDTHLSGTPATPLPMTTGGEVEEKDLLFNKLEDLFGVLHLLEHELLAGVGVDEGEGG